MSGKKVVFLMEYPIDLLGGGQMSTWTLCDGLLREGFEPVVICPKLLKKNQSDYDFKVVEYPSNENRERNKLSRIWNFLTRIYYFDKLIKKEKPDLIHVSMSESLITFGFLRCLGIFADIPFVYTDRGLAYGYRKHSKWCILKTLRHASGMICTTEFNKNLWEKDKCPIGIDVIPNTISKAFDLYIPDKRVRMRQQYDISDDELVLGFAGRISEEKDWEFVPQIVKSIHDYGIEFKVALVISVYEEQDARISREIREGITSSIGEENLIYMQDLSQDEMADYYYMVDIFVMSSNFESFGKAAVEAMSRRCAVVSTMAGGLPEVIGKEENLYTKTSLDKLCERVEVLKDSKDELDADKEFFYNRYRNCYTKEVHVLRHAELYRKIWSDFSQ